MNAVCPIGHVIGAHHWYQILFSTDPEQIGPFAVAFAFVEPTSVTFVVRTIGDPQSFPRGEYATVLVIQVAATTAHPGH